MDVALDLGGVDRLEYKGQPFTTRAAMTVLLDRLKPEEADDVTVFFASGVQTSLAKLAAAQGDDAVRVDGEKGYL